MINLYHKCNPQGDVPASLVVDFRILACPSDSIANCPFSPQPPALQPLLFPNHTSPPSHFSLVVYAALPAEPRAASINQEPTPILIHPSTCLTPLKRRRRRRRRRALRPIQPTHPPTTPEASPQRSMTIPSPKAHRPRTAPSHFSTPTPPPSDRNPRHVASPRNATLSTPTPPRHSFSPRHKPRGKTDATHAREYAPHLSPPEHSPPSPGQPAAPQLSRSSPIGIATSVATSVAVRFLQMWQHYFTAGTLVCRSGCGIL